MQDLVSEEVKVDSDTGSMLVIEDVVLVCLCLPYPGIALTLQGETLRKVEVFILIKKFKGENNDLKLRE